jgi:hypothetical protein
LFIVSVRVLPKGHYDGHLQSNQRQRQAMFIHHPSTRCILAYLSIRRTLAYISIFSLPMYLLSQYPTCYSPLGDPTPMSSPSKTQQKQHTSNPHRANVHNTLPPSKQPHILRTFSQYGALPCRLPPMLTHPSLLQTLKRNLQHVLYQITHPKIQTPSAPSQYHCASGIAGPHIRGCCTSKRQAVGTKR